MKLYLDASALVKRYVDEIGSDVVGVAMSRADTCSICRVGYVETVRAVARGGEPDDLTRVDRDWMGFHIVEVDRSVTETAAHLGIKAGLRTLDALHLAAALSLAGAEIVFATWDARLHRAAQARGLRTLPAVLG